MRSYRRVTYEDRCQIRAFLQSKVSVSKMASELGFHKSSIYRELSRNHIKDQGYRVGGAHQLWLRRIRNCRRPQSIRGMLEIYVVNRLIEGWSPEQICGRLKLEKRGESLSPPTVYRFIRRHWGAFKHCLKRFNRRGVGRLRMRRYRRTMGLSLHDRPKAANQRRRRGDWERDCLLVKDRKLVLVCTDRLSRYTVIARAPEFNGKAISALTWEMLSSLKKHVYSITNDNGTEFRDGPNMPARVYYCDPHKPQQRGTVENTIGLIRRRIKNNTPFRTLTDQKIQSVQSEINHRPRKCLDYQTPFEVFFKKKVALVM